MVSMKVVFKSRSSLAILAVAAVVYAVGTGFACLAWATMPEFNQGHYVGYYRTDSWLSTSRRGLAAAL